MPAEIDIEKLKENSIQIFEDCLLPNGCLVAAPTHMPYYPKNAKSYMYSWPGRDAGFALASMILIGKDYYEPVLEWIWDRAEDFQHAVNKNYLGLIYRSYYPNGLLREYQFQPDQGATLIWSIYFKKELTQKPLTDLEEKIVNRLAQNYVRVWDEKLEDFTLSIEDLWEERGRQPGEGVLTYSIVACAKALAIAAQLLDDDECMKTAQSMKNVIHKYCFTSNESKTPRAFGGNGNLEVDYTIDGSLAGLVWPFNWDFPKEQLQKILYRIEQEITDPDFGVFRYPKDVYTGADGIHHANDGAGTWPLLTFWLSIAYKELGDEAKAKVYFELPFKHMAKPYFIPEQIFENKPNWEGIKPLLWSHAMAIFAAYKLGYLHT